jgi:uncharacterized protein (TIGR03066 family)
MKIKGKKSKAAPQTRGTPSQSGLFPKWAVALAVVAIGATATYALFAYVIFPKIPNELVGRWRVVSGQLQGATFEFHRNGTMIGTMTVNGKDNMLEGTAQSDGKTLHTTTTNPLTGKAETGTQTIVTLTETEFVTEDARGTRITMRRQINE